METSCIGTVSDNYIILLDYGFMIFIMRLTNKMTLYTKNSNKSDLRWDFWITITMMLFSIMRSWRRMSINRTRGGMVGWSRGIDIRCWGNSYGMVGYMVMFYGLYYHQTTDGDN